ncbi:Tubulin/FtsZ, GTPase domain-containing protein [Kickxella alabastrina]|uniref:Tubulin/FtsZ, GTPase domain-containing protein n=1 Tax=Kickxella alabastrina TaxID=61397 RepID=UPI00221F3AF9|nr:Tubulin/FtsZ, GTPase domain-containing protein [Kickxella alabastrina]KAI7826709.1 Tubulin/FtsZ, GTPase domain-containing protein [Kickxella alabastrina]
MKEVITLQFGEQANYVGMHYWNMMQAAALLSADTQTQYPVDMDTLYCERPGLLESAQREHQAYAPRALIFDKVGNFGSLDDQDTDANKRKADQEEGTQWGSGTQQTEVYRQPLYSRRPISDVHESNIRFWSDYAELNYHPRTLNSVSGVEFGNSLGQMNTFQEGQGVFAGENSREDVLEGRMREFAEECDQIQGFQVLADAYGGFAGYASAYMEKVREEFPKTTIALYNVSGSTVESMEVAHQMDAAISLATALELGVPMVVPLFAPSHMDRLRPGIDVRSGLFQNSAFLAMNVAQWSHPLLTRVRSLDEIVDQTTQQQYFRLAESLLAPGIHIGEGAKFEQLGGLLGSQFAACSAVEVGAVERLAGQLFVDRGTALTRVVSERYDHSAYLDCKSPVALSRSFPPIFRGISSNGKRTTDLSAQNAHQNAQPAISPERPESVGVAGLLCTTTGSTKFVEKLHYSLKTERSKHLKDYERESIREFRYTLDSTIDKYSSI